MPIFRCSVMKTAICCPSLTSEDQRGSINGTMSLKVQAFRPSPIPHRRVGRAKDFANFTRPQRFRRLIYEQFTQIPRFPRILLDGGGCKSRDTGQKQWGPREALRKRSQGKAHERVMQRVLCTRRTSDS